MHLHLMGQDSWALAQSLLVDRCITLAGAEGGLRATDVASLDPWPGTFPGPRPSALTLWT